MGLNWNIFSYAWSNELLPEWNCSRHTSKEAIQIWLEFKLEAANSNGVKLKLWLEFDWNPASLNPIQLHPPLESTTTMKLNCYAFYIQYFPLLPMLPIYITRNAHINTERHCFKNHCHLLACLHHEGILKQYIIIWCGMLSIRCTSIVGSLFRLQSSG